MMQLFGALVLFTTLSTACGLRCYFCTALTKNCTDTVVCAAGLDRCYSVKVLGITVSKGCGTSRACIGPIECCEGDLCNTAALTGHSAALTGHSAALTGHSAALIGPSVILLLMSSTIITPFL